LCRRHADFSPDVRRWGAARFDETAGCGRDYRNRRSDRWTRTTSTILRGRRRAPGTLTPAFLWAAGPERRNSARRKLAAVTRLLRGEPLETVARELNVTVARLSEWRDRALVAAEAAMKERERDSRDEELLRLKAKLGEVCETMGCDLLACDGEADHLHAIIEYPPKVSISALVNALKGTSSRLLRKERPDIARRYVDGGLWSPSYFAASTGGAPLDVVRRYVEQQRASASP
jgi:putative transposase